MNARTTGDKFAFAYCTTDTSELLRDDRVHAVVIATRRGSHAHFAASALRAGKAVFVEKPLAMDEEGLQRVLDAQRESGQLLTVGFNRSFSPFAETIRDAFRGAGPLAITYYVNAGQSRPAPGSTTRRTAAAGSSARAATSWTSAVRLWTRTWWRSSPTGSAVPPPASTTR
jgi:predicted dehydrogenase